jgi:ribonuclease D
MSISTLADTLYAESITAALDGLIDESDRLEAAAAEMEAAAVRERQTEMADWWREGLVERREMFHGGQ